jgi:hypothetical protein
VRTTRRTRARAYAAPMDPRLDELLPVIEQFGFHSGDIGDMRTRFHEVCSTFPAPGGVPHVFPAYPTLTPECDQSLSAIEAFLNDWSGPPTVSATSSSPT